MPPILAGLLTASFIAFLFYRDAARVRAASAALWLPVFWMTITGSRFVSQWLDLGRYDAGSSAGDGSPIDALYFATLIIAATIVLCRRGAKVGELVSLNKCLFIFMLYGLVSVLWSDFPFIALKRWVKTLGHPLMALIILTDPDPRNAFRIVMRRCAYSLLPISALFIKYYPEYGRGFDNWSGESTNNGIGLTKNDLGYICMILGLFFFWNLQLARCANGERRDWYEAILNIGFLCLTGLLLSMSNSATSFATLMLGALTLALLNLRSISKRFGGAYLIAALAIAVIAQATFDVYSEVIVMLGRNLTLSDRAVVWVDALALQDSPVFGLGFESFWMGERLDVLWKKWWWHPNQAHNGYIETYLNLGLIGVVLLSLVILATFRSISRALARGDDFARLRMAYFFAILAFNYTEAAFKGVHFVWTVFYIIAIDASVPKPASKPALKPAPRPARSRRAGSFS